MSRSGRRGFLYRWRWLLGCAVVVGAAVVLAGLAAVGPQAVVYPTTDFAHLPVGAVPPSCVSLTQVSGSVKLVDQACGSPASTFRVIGRVSDASQCVRDADLTYSGSGPGSGAVCLDYDWAADQCLRITGESVSKVGCADRAAVRPDMAVIGAVDVSYCREGGIAHPVRHFTVCTIAADKNCNGRKRGT